MEDEITLKALKLTVERLKKQATDETKLIRIPPKLYQANPEAFTPQLVSVGPFHHIGHNFNRFKDVNILAMEGKKRMYMLSFLGEFNAQTVKAAEDKLEACKNLLNEKSRDIWNCYSEEIDMSEELLVKIMLVDGCFILGLLFGQNDIDHASGRYPRDLALFENQIPFSVLEGLFHICWSTTDTSAYLERQSSLRSKLLCFFRLTPETPPPLRQETEFKHLLDFISKCHRIDEQPTNDVIVTVVHCTIGYSKGIQIMNAAKLWAAGVTFQSVSGKRLLDVEFSRGLLKFPPLVIHDCTETILTNLLAYEHLSPHDRQYFTSYVVLMSHLIKNQDDFQLLEKQGIFVNDLTSRDYASKIFCNISKQFVIKDFYYRDLCNQVEAYTNSRWQRYVQELKQRCFNSPWTTVSVLAATVLLFLTALQTIFSVLSYYRPTMS